MVGTVSTRWVEGRIALLGQQGLLEDTSNVRAEPSFPSGRDDEAVSELGHRRTWKDVKVYTHVFSSPVRSPDCS